MGDNWYARTVYLPLFPFPVPKFHIKAVVDRAGAQFPSHDVKGIFLKCRAYGHNSIARSENPRKSELLDGVLSLMHVAPMKGNHKFIIMDWLQKAKVKGIEGGKVAVHYIGTYSRKQSM